MTTTENNVQVAVQQAPAVLTQEQAKLLLNEAERVKAERAALKGRNPEEMIEYYLDYMQSRKPTLGAKYPLNAKEKTVKDCYQYITNRVQKEAGNNRCAMVEHPTIFAWAEEYFINDSIEKYGKQANKPNLPTKDVTQRTSTKTDYDFQREKYEAWEKQHQTEIEKWNKAHQNELFYNPDDCPELKKTNPFPKPEDKPAETTEAVETINGETVNTLTGEILDNEEDEIGEDNELLDE